MQFDIPQSVSVPIGINDTQLSFVRNALVDAARRSGLPPLEQIDFANLILRLPINLEELDKLLDVTKQQKAPAFRVRWIGKDPSPKDGTLEIQDWEFKKLRGGKFTYFLNDVEKEELKRRQIYYQLNGGVLGSNRDISATDIIIVNLNFVYNKKQFNQTTAQAAFQKQISFAEKVYGVIEIKFYPIWTAGSGSAATVKITEGRKNDFVNVFLSIGGQASGLSFVDTINDERTGEAITQDVFITKGQGEGGGGLSDYSLREEALAHELGHKFGLTGDPNDTLLGYKELGGFQIRNWVSDTEINSAIKMLARGAVRKGFDWNLLGRNRRLPSNILPRNMKEFWASISTYDKMRIGARRLSKAY